LGRGAEIAENKIKWYLTVITIDYIDYIISEKKTGVLNFNSGMLKTLLRPLVSPMAVITLH
jgi:hypothetical protein